MDNEIGSNTAAIESVQASYDNLQSYVATGSAQIDSLITQFKSMNELIDNSAVSV